MVSWGDGEESSEHLSDASTESITTMYDSDYSGLADGASPERCTCGAVATKHVAFEGVWIGRRYLGCGGEDGMTCDYVRWVDKDWPSSLGKAVGKLWDMYREVKDGRVNDALDYVEVKLNHRDEMKKLNGELKIVQDELNKTVQEKQLILALKAKAEQALIDARAELDQKKLDNLSASNLHKVMRIKAEKERDKFKEEKRKMEYMIDELLKQKSGMRAKIRKIKELCDE